GSVSTRPHPVESPDPTGRPSLGPPPPTARHAARRTDRSDRATPSKSVRSGRRNDVDGSRLASRPTLRQTSSASPLRPPVPRRRRDPRRPSPEGGAGSASGKVPPSGRPAAPAIPPSGYPARGAG